MSRESETPDRAAAGAHIAQLNIARLAYDPEDPRVADFMNALDRINAVAERSPGFVWRLKDEAGASSMNVALDPGDPRLIVNMSVWETTEALANFVWKTVHARIYARKDEWFGPLGEEKPTGFEAKPHFVMWRIAPGHRPTVAEAAERLADLERNGPSERAFGWEQTEESRLWREKRCA